MLLAFAQARTGKAPSQLDVADVDAGLIGAFLRCLENERRQQRPHPQRPAGRHPLAATAMPPLRPSGARGR